MALRKRDRAVLASLARTADLLTSAHPSNPADTKAIFKYAQIRTKALRAMHLALSELSFGDPADVAAEFARDAYDETEDLR